MPGGGDDPRYGVEFEMLLELNIKDLAIIDNVNISFGPGFNVFTGETGAGKSIIIGAIDLVLGDRASGELIRSAAEEARVEALFDVSGNTLMATLLDNAGLPQEATLAITRIIQRSGKNKIFINGSISTLVTLTEIGRRLIDIYGQSEHQSLTRTEEHLEMLDHFGGTENLRKDMSAAYAAFAALSGELDGLTGSVKKRGEEMELLKFQFNEIENAAIKPGEDMDIAKERERLKNSERLHSASSNAERAVYSDGGSVLSRLGSVIKELKEASRFDSALEDVVKRFSSAAFELEDAAAFLRDYAGKIESNPAGLEELEERLYTLERLKKKYGPLLEDVFKKKEEIDRGLKGVEDFEERLKELTAKAAGARAAALSTADILGRARREKAQALKKGLEKELSELGMKGCRFEAAIESDKNSDGSLRFGEKGADRVVFFISANPGEEVKPLSKVASGGELSRIMLAMKGSTAAGKVPTLIFDEVDSGIGGATAQAVGRKIKAVSKVSQVICITHLAQIAAFADTHYNVEKVKSREGRTVTRVKKLAAEERAAHMARMLAGTNITDTTLKQARELIAAAKK